MNEWTNLYIRHSAFLLLIYPFRGGRKPAPKERASPNWGLLSMQLFVKKYIDRIQWFVDACSVWGSMLDPMEKTLY